MKSLKISKDLSLPLDITTQTVAILAKRRVGKSYTMRGIAEQLLDCGQQVVLVDPKGDQWGIRSSADGKQPGYPMVILGGEHGDAPLEVNAGEVVAKLVVEERVSVLLDLSSFRKHEIATFMAIFLENLYRLKAQEKYRTPVMLVIDEADAIAPQKPQKGEERMLGAAEDIVRRGGQRGIGCILVTQRSAVLNKNVLTQAQVLIVLRTIAPQDLSAMKAWIDVHGTLEEGKKLMDSLPSLPVGDAWFWSPGWPTAEGIFKLVHVLPIKTFDSAATPKPGEKKVTPKNLADVDLEALKKQMSETIEKAKNDNPAVLKKRISELERELIGKGQTTNFVPVSMGVSQWAEYGKKNGYWDFFVKKELQAKNEELYKWQTEWQKQIQNWFNILKGIGESMQGMTIKKIVIKPVDLNVPVVSPERSVARPVVEEHKQQFDSQPALNGEIKPLSKCAKTILTYLYSVYPQKKTQTQLWIATGYSPGGTFRNCIYELTGASLIAGSPQGYSTTHPSIEPNPAFDTNLQKWDSKVSLCARKIFHLLLEDPNTPVDRDTLAQQTGYSMGGTFRNCIYELTGVELIKKVADGYIINPEALDLN